jgi:hypothetical protein
MGDPVAGSTEISHTLMAPDFVVNDDEPNCPRSLRKLSNPTPLRDGQFRMLEQGTACPLDTLRLNEFDAGAFEVSPNKMLKARVQSPRRLAIVESGPFAIRYQGLEELQKLNYGRMRLSFAKQRHVYVRSRSVRNVGHLRRTTVFSQRRRSVPPGSRYMSRESSALF